MSSDRISPDTAEAIEANREELEALAESEYSASPVAEAVLSLLD